MAAVIGTQGRTLLARRIPTADPGIDCSNNQLKELPDTIGNCKDLSEFKASNNNIQSLPDELVNCKRLMKMEVEGNKLTQIPKQLIA